MQCFAVCCSVLQCVAVHVFCNSQLTCLKDPACVAVCCSVLQCVLQCVAVCCSVLQCVAVCCSACIMKLTVDVPERAKVCCSVLQCVAVYCSVLQCVAGVLQCVAGHVFYNSQLTCLKEPELFSPSSHLPSSVGRPVL